MVLLETGIVTRTIGVDFIYFDILFLIIWISFLIKKKYWIPIIWGLIGFVVYIICEVIIWYWIMGVRHYSGPVNIVLFFIWFCFSPGFAQFSYAFVMMEKRNFKELIFWTVLFYAGWTFVGVFSQLLPINDGIITVSREMQEGNQRLIMSLMAIFNLILGLILAKMKKIRYQDVIYLFIIGTLDEFCLEFSLAVSGIRQGQGTWSLELMIINTLIEFNLGVVLMYLIFVAFRYKRDKNYYDPISFSDFKEIKTDFNRIALISNKPDSESSKKAIKDLSDLYKKEDIVSDLAYYHKKYLNQDSIKETIEI